MPRNNGEQNKTQIANELKRGENKKTRAAQRKHAILHKIRSSGRKDKMCNYKVTVPNMKVAHARSARKKN